MSSANFQVTTRTLGIADKAAPVKGVLDGSGKAGLDLNPEARFRVDQANALPKETVAHRHGQISPNVTDGVSNTSTMIAVFQRDVRFCAAPGSHWMDSHVLAQEIDLLLAPLIVRSAEDAASDRQEVAMLLHNLNFRFGKEVLEQFTFGAAMSR